MKPFRHRVPAVVEILYLVWFEDRRRDRDRGNQLPPCWKHFQVAKVLTPLGLLVQRFLTSRDR